MFEDQLCHTSTHSPGVLLCWCYQPCYSDPDCGPDTDLLGVGSVSWVQPAQGMPWTWWRHAQP